MNAYCECDRKFVLSIKDGIVSKRMECPRQALTCNRDIVKTSLVDIPTPESTMPKRGALSYLTLPTNTAEEEPKTPLN